MWVRVCMNMITSLVRKVLPGWLQKLHPYFPLNWTVLRAMHLAGRSKQHPIKATFIWIGCSSIHTWTPACIRWSINKYKNELRCSKSYRCNINYTVIKIFFFYTAHMWCCSYSNQHTATQLNWAPDLVLENGSLKLIIRESFYPNDQVIELLSHLMCNSIMPVQTAFKNAVSIHDPSAQLVGSLWYDRLLLKSVVYCSTVRRSTCTDDSVVTLADGKVGVMQVYRSVIKITIHYNYNYTDSKAVFRTATT